MTRSARTPVIASREIKLALLTFLALAFKPYLFPPLSDPGVKKSAGGGTTIWNSNNDLSSSDFSLPMCDISGKCHEIPHVPTPRTVFSAKSREQYDLWWERHAKLNESATVYAQRRSTAGEETKRPLVLLGDSITESWLGTDLGRHVNRTEGVPSLLRDMAVENHLDPLVLGISGDQTQHLLWRLDHGELLPEFADNPDTTFVMLIGTNNLGSGILPEPTARGILTVAEYVLSHTYGRLVLLQLLPRGDGKQKLPRLCPGRCDANGEPFKSFMPAVNKVNAAIRDAAPNLSTEYGGRLVLVDCGAFFHPKEIDGKRSDDTEVDEALMPDRLHPNAEGHRILATCILDCINGRC